jgi:hypothetical protein
MRTELLTILTSPSHVRADVIKQMYERDLDLAEVLMDLEADELLRSQVIEILRHA